MFLSYYGYYKLAIGSKLPAAATKGKLTSNIKKYNPVDDSDKLSSLQSNDKLNSSNDNDEDNNNYDVVWMTDQKARQMFNDEVSFSHSSFCL